MSKLIEFLKMLLPPSLFYPPAPTPYVVTVDSYTDEELSMASEMLEPVLTVEQVAEANKQAKKKAANAKRAATRKANKLAKEKAQA
jgi:hypothetical protein|tara:strand:- start:1487 stop:1744 length:258 start_codon:yes stop_codon:yes gene_type:complete